MFTGCTQSTNLDMPDIELKPIENRKDLDSEVSYDITEVSEPVKHSQENISTQLFTFGTGFYFVTVEADPERWMVCENPLVLISYPREFYPTGCLPSDVILGSVPFDHFFFDPDYNPGGVSDDELVDSVKKKVVTNNGAELLVNARTIFNSLAGMKDPQYITMVFVEEDIDSKYHYGPKFYFVYITSERASDLEKTEFYDMLKTLNWTPIHAS